MNKKIILKYLRNTKDEWLVYGETDLKLMGFTNFNFQSDHDDSKSISDYIFTLNGGVICWKSSKQHTVTVGAKTHLRRISWSRRSRGRRRDLQGKSKPEVGLLR